MNYSEAENAAIRDARRRLYKDKKWAKALHAALLENLSEAIGEEDPIRIDMFAAAVALVDDMVRDTK